MTEIKLNLVFVFVFIRRRHLRLTFKSVTCPVHEGACTTKPITSCRELRVTLISTRRKTGNSLPFGSGVMTSAATVMTAWVYCKDYYMYRILLENFANKIQMKFTLLLQQLGTQWNCRNFYQYLSNLRFFKRGLIMSSLILKRIIWSVWNKVKEIRPRTNVIVRIASARLASQLDTRGPLMCYMPTWTRQLSTSSPCLTSLHWTTWALASSAMACTCTYFTNGPISVVPSDQLTNGNQ